MRENPERDHSVEGEPTGDLEIERLKHEIKQLRIMQHSLMTQVWELQHKEPEPEPVLKEKVRRNTLMLQSMRYSLVLVLGAFSIFYAGIAGLEISSTSDQGQVTFKGSEFLSGLSAFAGGIGVSVLGFADRLGRKSYPKNR